MGFVYEVVKEEDRELFNSFLPSRKANECTRWVADRERNIYSFYIGGEIREGMYEYFLAWDDLKIYIYTQVRSGKEDIYMWINGISIPQRLRNDNGKIKQIVEMIKEILQIMYNNKIVFKDVVTPSFRKGDN